MTDIEQKALALVNDCGGKHTYLKREWNPRYEALCRAIEQHEAFRQKVSDAVVQTEEKYGSVIQDNFIRDNLGDFIIPKPKPDPLVAALEGVTFDHYPPNDAKTIRAALDALGFEIREKNDD